jgi:6-phosphogluconate dehydrogenase
MTSSKSDKDMSYDIGMVGLGVMGRNLLLNMADHGFSVAGYDRDKSKVAALLKESEKQNIQSAEEINEFINLLRVPRAIMLLVPAGAPVDAVINELAPLLKKGDLIIDAGNSHYTDTNLRAKNLAKKAIQFLGIGVSGGEEGARHGPSIMPGGPKEAYERVRPILEAISAKINGDPCVAYLGDGSAGHFVKMVHNGIEYGIMQLISETYDIMKRGLEMNDDQIHDVFNEWNKSELKGYLIEITSKIFDKQDATTGKRLIDEILDVARQKGTGMWTSQSAMELEVPTPTIDLAVAMRELSVLEQQRVSAKKVLPRAISKFMGDKNNLLLQMKNALYIGTIMTYAQGMALLTVASKEFEYHFKLETIARIWRGGCIIRSALLEVFREAYRADSNLANLILNPTIAKMITDRENDLRRVVCSGAEIGVPVSGFMTVLGYLDSYRCVWLPANLIQAQRDFFGSHSYERIDCKGTFHTEWEQNE